MEVKISSNLQTLQVVGQLSSPSPSHQTDLEIPRTAVLGLWVCAAFLFVSSVSRDSLFQCFPEASAQSFSVKFRISLALS